MLRIKPTVVAVVIAIFCHVSYAQDSVRVYFEFGKSQLTYEAKDVLYQVPSIYDLNSVDSIAIIGYADSVGRISENFKLSLKRAKNVGKYTAGFLDESIPVSVYAKGEDFMNNDNVGRRVEFVMYYPDVLPEEAAIVISDADPQCFTVALEALSYCHITEFKKRKRNYVRIESENVAVMKDYDYYYLKKERNGKVEARSIRWKLKETGNLWWERPRLVAEITKESFDKSQIFRLDTGNCERCNLKQITTADTLFKRVPHHKVDAFLMSNIEIKKKRFRRSVFKMRVPAEYIDVSKGYYFSYSRQRLTSGQPGERIEWQTKKGRRHSPYYYTKVKTQNGDIPYISKVYSTIECFDLVRDTTYSSFGRRGPCVINDYSFGGLFRNLRPYFGPQLGGFYQNDSLVGYLGIRMSLTNGYVDYTLDVGLNSKLGVYMNAGADYRFLRFGERFYRLSKSWNRPLKSSPTLFSQHFLYTGLAVKTISNNRAFSFLESNVHLGWGYDNFRWRFLNRMFVEAGIGYDLLRKSNTTYYPFIQAGVRMDIPLGTNPKFTNTMYH